MALALLLSAEREIATGFQEMTKTGRARADLALAYERLGRGKQARQLLDEALEAEPSAIPADRITVMRIDELRGEFLLAQPDISAAESIFRKVIRDADKSTVEFVARAYGGLASAAIYRKDISAADELSRGALEAFENVIGVRDIRTQPYLWLIRARALLLGRNTVGAVDFASRALAAYRNYEDPASADINDAKRTLNAALIAGVTRASEGHRSP